MDTASTLRKLEETFNNTQQSALRDAKAQAVVARNQRVSEAMSRHLNPTQLQSIVSAMRRAAEHGERRYLALRVPSEICTDEGRRINSAQPGWGTTLQGEAADLFRFWEETLQPLGFKLLAEVLDFPGGKPGDIGLSFTWR